jgi:SAM-dependent methyltransferase
MPPSEPAPGRASIWEKEAAFFNEQAARASIAPLDPLVVARYAGKLKPWLEPEYKLSLIRESLTGKSVLVVGCGEGETVAMLAALGAKVTGIDISPGAIQVAKSRVAINGLQAELLVGPIEAFVPATRFDVVYVESLLHHVIHDLDNVMAGLVRCCSGRIVCSEPINLFAPLRALRLALGDPTGTPDERPLEAPELAVMRRHMPTMHLRHFRIVGRLGKYVLNTPYERAPRPRKLAYDLLTLIDRALLAIPGGSRLSSVAVMHWDVGLRH